MDHKIFISRDDLLHWLRQDCDRALETAARNLTDDRYDVTDGLFTRARIEVTDKKNKKFAKHKQVGHAVTLRQWQADDDE
jgi:hypothetical protein